MSHSHSQWDDSYDDPSHSSTSTTGGSTHDDDTEISCPLCMEEFDLTDRSFHPCRCGYQICLWCYHQLIEQSETKCPACRTPFNIVTMNGSGGGMGTSAALVAPHDIQLAATEAAQQAQRASGMKKKSANAAKERTTQSAASSSTPNGSGANASSGISSKDISNQLVLIEGAGLTPLSEVRIVQRNLCIAAGTAVNLASGTSIRIEALIPRASPSSSHHRASLSSQSSTPYFSSPSSSPSFTSIPSVLAYVPLQPGLHARPLASAFHQGTRDCIELQFNDGRTIICTHDHRVLTSSGEWIEANQLKVGESYVATGVEYPMLDDEVEDDKLRAEDDWKIDIDGVELQSSSSSEQTRACARLLGYMRSRHTILNSVDYSATLIFHHQQDATSCALDLAHFTSNEPQLSIIDSCIHLSLPSSLASSLISLLTSSTFASSILDTASTCFIREYIASYLGGTYHVELDENTSQFRLICDEFRETPDDHIGMSHNELASLLTRITTDANILTDIPTFTRTIGLRYASIQQLRLTVASSIIHSKLPIIDAINEFDAAHIFDDTMTFDITNTTLPIYRVRLTSRQTAGRHSVYDLSVPLFESPNTESSSLTKGDTIDSPATNTVTLDGSFTANGIIVHNCYVVGLSSACGRDDLLRKREWFGGFGRALKVAVAKSVGFAGRDATFACYITYKEKADAAEAIKAVNFASLGLLLAKGSSGAGGGHTDGDSAPRARASYGTTKYCMSWLKGQPCLKVSCLYLHALAPLSDCCTKDQLQRDRFDERFGVNNVSGSGSSGTGVGVGGKKPPIVVHAVATSVPPPIELNRSVSQPITSSTIISTTAFPPLQSPAAPSPSNATKSTALSFASVALGSSLNSASHMQTPPNEDDFPPLGTATTASNKPSTPSRFNNTSPPTLAPSMASPSASSPTTATTIEPILESDQTSIETDTADDDVESELDEVITPVTVTTPHLQPNIIVDEQQAKALEALFSQPIVSLPQLPVIVSTPSTSIVTPSTTTTSNSIMTTNKPIIRPPPGFGGMIRASSLPPGFHQHTNMVSMMTPTSSTSMNESNADNRLFDSFLSQLPPHPIVQQQQSPSQSSSWDNPSMRNASQLQGASLWDQSYNESNDGHPSLQLQQSSSSQPPVSSHHQQLTGLNGVFPSHSNPSSSSSRSNLSVDWNTNEFNDSINLNSNEFGISNLHLGPTPPSAAYNPFGAPQQQQQSQSQSSGLFGNHPSHQLQTGNLPPGMNSRLQPPSSSLPQPPSSSSGMMHQFDRDWSNTNTNVVSNVGGHLDLSGFNASLLNSSSSLIRTPILSSQASPMDSPGKSRSAGIVGGGGGSGSGSGNGSGSGGVTSNYRSRYEFADEQQQQHHHQQQLHLQQQQQDRERLERERERQLQLQQHFMSPPLLQQQQQHQQQQTQQPTQSHLHPHHQPHPHPSHQSLHHATHPDDLPWHDRDDGDDLMTMHHHPHPSTRFGPSQPQQQHVMNSMQSSHPSSHYASYPSHHSSSSHPPHQFAPQSTSMQQPPPSSLHPHPHPSTQQPHQQPHQHGPPSDLSGYLRGMINNNGSGAGGGVGIGGPFLPAHHHSMQPPSSTSHPHQLQPASVASSTSSLLPRGLNPPLPHRRPPIPPQ